MNRPLPEKKDLVSLYKAVREPLALSAARDDLPVEISNDVRAILGGLTTIVQGVAALRTHAGDAHGRERGHPKIDGRIARLALHTASAAALFLLETWERQTGRALPQHHAADTTAIQPTGLKSPRKALGIRWIWPSVDHPMTVGAEHREVIEPELDLGVRIEARERAFMVDLDEILPEIAVHFFEGEPAYLAPEPAQPPHLSRRVGVPLDPAVLSVTLALDHREGFVNLIGDLVFNEREIFQRPPLPRR